MRARARTHTQRTYIGIYTHTYARARSGLLFNAVRTHIVRMHAINLYTPLEVRAVQNAVEKFLHLTNRSRVHLLLLLLLSRSTVHPPPLPPPLFYLCSLTLAFCLCAYVSV